MARNYVFARQEAEALIDLLEDNADFQLHDHTAGDMAKELREMFGMCTREESMRRKWEAGTSASPITIGLNIRTYEGDFGSISTTQNESDKPQ
jgi:hypothetical protein